MNGHLGGTQNTLHIIALSRLAPPAKILDMGAGAGETVGLLRDMGYNARGELTAGDGLTLTFAPKGFGSENMSAVKMLKPADGAEGVKAFVLDAVRHAGPNPCPPIVVGVGIGGTFEKCAQLSKFALMRELDSHHPLPEYRDMEQELLAAINGMDIGPAGLGGRTSALAVHIETFPTHIAGLPVAVNICCHAYRHSTVTL